MAELINRFGIGRMLKSQLFQGTLIYTLSDVINKAIPFLLLPLLTTYLTPEEYGILANFNVSIALFVILCGFSSQGIINYYFFKKDRQLLNRIISGVITLMFCSEIILLALVLLFLGNLSALLSIPEEFILIAVIVAIFQFVTVIHILIYKLEKKAKHVGIYQITQTLLNLGLSVFLIVYLEMDVGGRIVGIASANVLWSIFSIWAFYRRGYVKINFSRSDIREILQFGLPLIPHQIGKWFKSFGDRYVITFLLGVSSVGIYSAALQVTSVMLVFINAFNSAYIPFLFERLEKRDQSLNVRIVKEMYCFFGLLIVGTGIYYLLIPILYDIMINEAYHSGIYLTLPLLMAICVRGISLMITSLIIYSKNTKRLPVIMVINIAVYLILSIFVAPEYNLIGLAWLLFFIEVINLVLMWAWSNKVQRMPWQLT
ncbi:lipopolysaccharide biosynthesis protein [Roseivirga pacifica]|uniref:lipopolysaccharide biosynthesis protein n=1 Tax=Roseivirga pacifica TaxID=1267423 RepID=UPI00227BAE0E|nr:oligosaccharide flippase family protein [Roseivirga pacifica]